ncbi:MAG: hypothetical protein AAF557_19665 [Pseudomonadota bacterium]
MMLISHLVRGAAGLFVISLVYIWLLSPPDQLPARFSAKECQHVRVIDPETGESIVGIEDLALWQNGSQLIFTAHDRRDDAKPNGGLYSVPIWDIAERAEVDAKHLYRPQGSFRPHGFAISDQQRRLALINRPADGETEILVGPLGQSGWRVDRWLDDPRFCRANDLDFNHPSNVRLRISMDRADCGPSIRDLAPWSRSGKVLSTDGGPIWVEQVGLSFPNGISGKYVAETRAKRISSAYGRALEVPGGPDNLTQTFYGDIVAALHPNLFLTGLGLGGWWDNIPTRIVRVEPKNGGVEVLFDDPSGRVYSGATVAILTGDQLIAGSAIDHGLLVCGDGL